MTYPEGPEHIWLDLDPEWQEKILRCSALVSRRTSKKANERTSPENESAE